MLGDGEDEVGGGHERVHLAGDLVADDLGQDHGDGLAEHDGLSLDTAHAPANDAEAVDHGGVRVGADDGVGVDDVGVGEADAGEVLEVDLVDDAGAGGHDEHVLEGLGAPLEEGEALAVPLELELLVLAERGIIAGKVHLNEKYGTC